MTKSVNPGMSSAESRQFNYLMRIIPIRDQNWIDRAACADHPDPDLWFPKETTGRPPGVERLRSIRAAEAVRICRDVCRVQTECLTFALQNKEDHGIWAGTGPAERHDLRRAS